MSKQQTAVEWLLEQLELIWSIENLPKYIDKKKEVIEQAKAMEQQNIKEMYLKGIENYDPTFKSK